MPRLAVKQLNSLAELRDIAPAWDDLWQRSEIALPTARAELVALWCESFAPHSPLRAFVVEQDGQLVAALPLIEGRWRGLKFGRLPGNHWSPAGDILIDPRCDTEAVLAQLLQSLRRAAWPVLWFGAVPGDTARWQAFFAALRVQGMTCARRRRFAIDRVAIQDDWDNYFDARTRNHRHHMRKAEARAQRAGSTELTMHDRLSPHEVEPLLRTCFEIEAAGWKGQASGAVLNAPVALEFYQRQARQLAAWGQLAIVCLRHDARTIAFEYGWRGKDVYFSPKVGYDESFAQFSPGQLLRRRLLEAFHATDSVRWVDFLGPASAATSRWATEQYAVDRAMIATRGPLNRALVASLDWYGKARSSIAARRLSSPTPSAPADSHDPEQDAPATDLLAEPLAR